MPVEEGIGLGWSGLLCKMGLEWRKAGSCRGGDGVHCSCRGRDWNGMVLERELEKELGQCLLICFPDCLVS